MEYLAVTARFVLSIWLWSITFGIIHCFVGAVVLFLTIFCSPGTSLKRAFLLSTSSYICAQIILTAGALLFGPHAYAFYYPTLVIKPEDIAIDAFYESFVLGATYTVLQLLFFMIVLRQSTWRSLGYYFVVLTFSNGTASYISYVSIRLAMWYL